MMLNNYFDFNEHTILCRTTSDGSDGFPALSANIINWKDLGRGKIRKFIGAGKTIDSSKNIFIWGLTFSWKWLILLYLKRKVLKERGVWVIVGVDLHDYIRSKKSLKNMILNHIETELRNSCRTAVTIFPTDIPVYQQLFGIQNAVFCAPLGFSETSFAQWDAELDRRKKVVEKYPDAYTKVDRKVSIQVGHNKFTYENHAWALSLLEKYKSNNFLITMPMSYGNDCLDSKEDYCESVKKLAYYFFPPEKIRILTGLLPIRKYYEFLSGVDVAIFCAKRQSALGNLIPLLYLGKKVFLDPDNILLDFFRKKGFEVHDINEIRQMPYEELVAPIKKAYPNPWIKKFYSVESNAKRWNVVFGYADGRFTRDEANARIKELELEEESGIDSFNEKAMEEALLLKTESAAMEEEKARYDTITQELLAISEWFEKKEAEDTQKRMLEQKRKTEWETRRKELIKKEEDLKALEYKKAQLEREKKLKEANRKKLVVEVEEYHDKAHYDQYVLVIERKKP